MEIEEINEPCFLFNGKKYTSKKDAEYAKRRYEEQQKQEALSIAIQDTVWDEYGDSIYKNMIENYSRAWTQLMKTLLEAGVTPSMFK